MIPASPRPHCRFVPVCATVLALFCAAAQAQNYPDQTGYLSLVSRLNGNVPTGSTVVVGHAEPHADIGVGGYLPDTTQACFAGISFTVVDGPSIISGHATDVGGILYGSTYSLTRGIRNVKLFLADYTSGFISSPTGLNPYDPAGPANLGVQVLHNSWIMNTGSAVLSSQWIRRLDWEADAYDIVMVGGVANDPLITVPELSSTMYNGIAVGLLDSPSSLGPVTFSEADQDTSGRSKPDIVGPMSVTSAAAPLVSSAAVLLLDEANLRIQAGQSEFLKATKPAVIKSILLTGATKPAAWAKGDPSTTADDEVAPLDRKFGAGLLNFDHSELILSTGSQPPGWIASSGWTYAQSVAPGDSRLYYFILNETTAQRFAATLTWNRRVVSTGVPYTLDRVTLPHFQLELFTFADGTFSLVQASRSPKDNLQHLHVPTFPNGIYILRVSNVDTTTSDFALSWLTCPAGT